MEPLFENRRDAGLKLAVELEAYRGVPNLLVLALPRGGVPIGSIVAHHLGAPLDVLVVRKLGVPGREELALGAVARGGVRVLNDDIVRDFHIPQDTLAALAEEELEELIRREELYRGHHRALPIVGPKVIITDDGLATGATMRAAVAAVRTLGGAEVIVAVPVGSWPACERLAPLVDDLVCLFTPQEFEAVGTWYKQFPQVSDVEVRHLLNAPLAGTHGTRP